MRREYEAGDEEEDARIREDEDRMRQLARHRQTRAAKGILLIGILLILILFIVWNAHGVTFSFVFGDAEIGLIWIMLACAILGGIVGFIIGRPGRTFRFGHRDEDDPRDGPKD